MTTLPDFRLETHFSRWEFSARHHMTASDSQTTSMRDLLALADDDDRAAWDNITLGYTASPALAARLRTQSLRAYVTAQDPFLFTHFRGLDPESRTSSGVPSYYTLLAGVTLGL